MVLIDTNQEETHQDDSLDKATLDILLGDLDYIKHQLDTEHKITTEEWEAMFDQPARNDFYRDGIGLALMEVW